MRDWIAKLLGPSSEVLWLRARVEELERTIRDLKKGGFAYEPTPELIESAEPMIDDRITGAIDHMAAGNARLGGELADWAQAQLIMGEEVEDVVDSIYRGAEVI